MALETVVGLEVHVVLDIPRKLFCPCEAAHGGKMNSRVCPVCGGDEGARPVLNGQALQKAILAGLALGCEINRETGFDRKHYLSPDLIKGYQITQHQRPLAVNGHLDVVFDTGERRIAIPRLHMEEDAGKVVLRGGKQVVDLNRAGIALVEIVTGPDFKTGTEVAAFLRQLRKVLLLCGVTDGKMNEGSLRCDVNVSLHEAGGPLGTRTEIKNLNSFRAIIHGVEAERRRQESLLEKGETISSVTCRYDAKAKATVPIREKETVSDYGYVPDNDLPAVCVSTAEIEALRASLPVLKPVQEPIAGLSDKQMAVLASKEWALEAVRNAGRAGPTVAKLLIGEVFRLQDKGADALGVNPAHLTRVAVLLDEGLISGAVGKQVVSSLFEKDEAPDVIVARNNLWQISDENVLLGAVKDALMANPKMVAGYLGGKEKLLMALMGDAMKRLAGKGNPAMLKAMLARELNKG